MTNFIAETRTIAFALAAFAALSSSGIVDSNGGDVIRVIKRVFVLAGDEPSEMLAPRATSVNRSGVRVYIDVVVVN
jgi:hypothetical protein